VPDERKVLVTEVSPFDGPASGVIAALSELRGDQAGIETFGRYLWQAKQAVRLWLTCLSETDGPVCVICEHIDDTLVVYRDRIRFLQFKTRDRGSWSAKRMSTKGNGIDALIRSYDTARSASLHANATFELWFEGPISEEKETGAFVADPVNAEIALRKRITDLGLRKEWMDDFLGRLVIQPGQPSQAHIDALAIKELGALWPGMTMVELENLYDTLLNSATAAQGRARLPVAIRLHLAAVVPTLQTLSSVDGLEEASGDIAPQILSGQQLRVLTPPLPAEPVEGLLERIADGLPLSRLELKLRSAGASSDTIDEAKRFRAMSEVKRQEALAGRLSAEADLEDLADRLLIVARAEARRTNLAGASAAARPAEAIAAELLSDPARLKELDERELFGRDWRLVFGYLCHLSDECRFPWRAA
jgi:hypothetical protein